MSFLPMVQAIRRPMACGQGPVDEINCSDAVKKQEILPTYMSDAFTEITRDVGGLRQNHQPRQPESARPARTAQRITHQVERESKRLDTHTILPAFRAALMKIIGPAAISKMLPPEASQGQHMFVANNRSRRIDDAVCVMEPAIAELAIFRGGPLVKGVEPADFVEPFF